MRCCGPYSFRSEASAASGDAEADSGPASKCVSTPARRKLAEVWAPGLEQVRPSSGRLRPPCDPDQSWADVGQMLGDVGPELASFPLESAPHVGAEIGQIWTETDQVWAISSHAARHSVFWAAQGGARIIPERCFTDIGYLVGEGRACRIVERVLLKREPWRV